MSKIILNKNFFLGNVNAKVINPKKLIFQNSIVKNFGIGPFILNNGIRFTNISSNLLLKSQFLPLKISFFNLNLIKKYNNNNTFFINLKNLKWFGNINNNRFSNSYYGSGSGSSSGGGNYDRLLLRKASIFTLIFCVITTYSMPYIFQYTPMKYFNRHPNQLIYTIIAINLAVFGAWRLPAFWKFTNRYFLLEKNSMYSMSSMIGSAFSHQEFWHIAMNMMCLYSLGSLVSVVGSSNFTTMYLNCAVLSSLASLAFPILARIPKFASLGASGALFGLFGCFAYLFPKSQILLFFLPIPGGAWIAFLASMGWNLCGCLFRWGSFDYAAHLGGSVAGIYYGWWISEQSKRKRENRMKKYGFY